MGGKRSGVSRKRRTLAKSYVTGGLDRLDRRASEARTVLQGAEQIIADAGGEVSLLKARAAHRVQVLDVLLSRDERTLLEGRPIDRAAYVAGVTAWMRLAAQIGLERRARRLPTLTEYIQAASGETTERATEPPTTAQEPST